MIHPRIDRRGFLTIGLGALGGCTGITPDGVNGAYRRTGGCTVVRGSRQRPWSFLYL